MRIAIVIAILSLISSIASSKTIHVPGDYNKIQEAIDAAVDGDTVLVAVGTYVENLDFKGKAITVKSGDGPVRTIVDGNKTGSVVKFENGEGNDSKLEGFTITNGSGTSSTGCMFGGGIYCHSASPTITNSIITANIAFHVCGLACGGGICCHDDSHPSFINNVITNNLSDSPLGSGGGIGCYQRSSAVLINNLLEGNWAEYRGGAVFCEESFLIITNTILWNNKSIMGREICVDGHNPSTLTIGYSDVDGGQALVHVGPNSTLNWGPGMIDADPLFVDPPNGDFHLSFQSPCKDTGDNSVVTELFDFEGDPRIAYGIVDMGADEFYTHLYWTGDAMPGGNVELKFVGLPGTTPVQLWLGSGVLDPPWPTKYGDWYLQFPLLADVALGTIPTNGVLLFPFTFPANTPTPLSLPFQTGIGAELSNLSVMVVE